VLSALVARGGPPRALRALQVWMARDDQVMAGAHMHAHEIGYQAYEAAPTLAGRLSLCLDVAAGGCFHGVLMRQVLAHGADAMLASASTCDGLRRPGVPRGTELECLHGLGHGMSLAALSRGRASGAAPGGPELREALQACQAVTRPGGSYHCFRGAFMEYMIAATVPLFHYPNPPKMQGDLHWPCRPLAEEFGEVAVHACYDYQGSWILSRSKSAQAAFASCLEAPGEVSQAACAANIGRDALAEGNGALTLCLQARASAPQLTGECVGGSAAYLIYRSPSPASLSAARTLCRQLPASERPACTRRVDQSKLEHMS